MTAHPRRASLPLTVLLVGLALLVHGCFILDSGPERPAGFGEDTAEDTAEDAAKDVLDTVTAAD